MCRHIVFLYSLICLIGFLPNESFAGSAIIDSGKANSLITGQQYIFNDQFELADSIFSEFIREYPDNPAGYCFSAINHVSQMADAEENIFESEMRSLLDSTTTIIKRRKQDADSVELAWLSLFEGHAKAYQAIWESRFGSLFSSIKLGLSSRGAYNRALEADPTNYDILFGLGNYHYWKSAKGGFLRTIGIFKNEKKKGITELTLAADSSLLSKQAAKSALIWVYIDMKKYDSALALARSSSIEFPNGKSFLWPVAQASFLKEDFNSSLETYKNLRERVAFKPGNFHNLVEIDYQLARCHEELGENSNAIKQARQFNEYDSSVPKQTRKKQKKKISYLVKLSQKIIVDELSDRSSD